MEVQMRKSLFFCVPFLAAFLLFISSNFAEEITYDNYIKYLPLSYPRIISQTKASKELNLYGDPKNDHDYDGIDDDRWKRLRALCKKFSPELYKNTSYSIPLNFMAVVNKTPLLHIDTWDLKGAEKKIIERNSINFAFTDNHLPFHSASLDSSMLFPKNNDTLNCLGKSLRSAFFHIVPFLKSHRENICDEDYKLLNLIREFDPQRKRTAKADPNQVTFKVLYFDFPGEDEKSWKKEYKNIISGSLPESYEKYSGLYAHPFIHQKKEKDGKVGYEFVIQYWFFYPFNDGANNHEGDWEHINVIITIYDEKQPDKLLSKEEIQGILKTEGQTVNDNQLFIKRVEYYFHHKVMILDYMKPNVYLTENKWKKEKKESIVEEKRNEETIWDEIRDRAWEGIEDRETLEINRQPIGYIGGDDKGLACFQHPFGSY